MKQYDADAASPASRIPPSPCHIPWRMSRTGGVVDEPRLVGRLDAVGREGPLDPFALAVPHVGGLFADQRDLFALEEHELVIRLGDIVGNCNKLDILLNYKIKMNYTQNDMKLDMKMGEKVHARLT